MVSVNCQLANRVVNNRLLYRVIEDDEKRDSQNRKSKKMWKYYVDLNTSQLDAEKSNVSISVNSLNVTVKRSINGSLSNDIDFDMLSSL